MTLQLIHLCEFHFGAVEGDAQAFGIADPAVLFGFGDAFSEVVDDVLEPVDLGGVGTEKGAAEAGVFVLAACAVGAAAAAQAEFALHEMGFEFVPFGRRLVRGILRWAE